MGTALIVELGLVALFIIRVVFWLIDDFRKSNDKRPE